MHRVALATCFAVAVGTPDPWCALAVEPEMPIVAAAKVEELGVVGRPERVIGRDGGESCRVGDKILWTFGDTIMAPPAEDGQNFRTCSVAWADLDSPLNTSEETDGVGAPLLAIPFSEGEYAYNKKTGKPDDRMALWVGGLVPTSHENALCFFSVIHVAPGQYNYTPKGVGAAEFQLGKTTARRHPGLLFTAEEPGFVRTLLEDGMVYLYGGLPKDFHQDFAVARAPLASATERADYEFWDGRRWTDDVTLAKPVFTEIPGQVSISYNKHLKCFLAINSRPLSDEVLARTALRPEGPWSEPRVLFRTPVTSEGINYAAIEHPELAKDDGRRIYITYLHPLPGFLRSELRLAEVTLK